MPPRSLRQSCLIRASVVHVIGGITRAQFDSAQSVVHGAAVSHLRVGDTKGLAMPAVPLRLSIAVLVLRIVTA